MREMGMQVLNYFLIGCACLAWSEPLLSSDRRPNVLLVCVDDLKPRLGCYGDSLAKTPNMDSFSKRAMVFDFAYCNQAVCSPSRNALMVGLRPQTLGIYDLATNFRKSRPNAVSWPELFKANGYQTQSLGKIFHVGHGNIDDERSWSVPSFRAKKGGYAIEANKLVPENSEYKNGTPTESADVPDDRYDDGSVALEAISRLQESARKPDQPFFLAVGFIKPHLPFVAPKKYWDLYNPEEIGIAKIQEPPQGAPSYAPQYGGELRNYRDVPKSGTLPTDLQRHLIHGYLASTSYMDQQFGLLMRELERLDLEKNTIVILWGDHGWHLGDHGMWCKHTNYEQATRIPFLMAGPGIRAGRTKAMIESVDVYPTVCELAGIIPTSKLDGTSFRSVLEGTSDGIRDHVIHVYPRSKSGQGNVLGRAIRTPRYRMVEWKPIGGSDSDAEYELYDYITDPEETKNLASEKEDVVQQLKKFLARHPTPSPQISSETKNNNSKQDRNSMFDKRDTNRDNRLTREEFLQGQPDPKDAPNRFTKFDVNDDGFLSREEFVSSGKTTTKP